MIHYFEAKIEIIGVNPFVFVPESILQSLFEQSGKQKGPIPICGKINEVDYTQTLVKFKGEWRLYINTSMLKNSPQRIGEVIQLSVRLDEKSREIVIPEKFLLALENNMQAKVVFETLPASRKKEIVRYLANLKNETTLLKNIDRAIQFLLGNERFVGRDKP